MIIIKFIKLKLANEQGNILSFSIIIFAVIFVLSMSAIAITSSNLKQAKQQEHHMEAYYLSYSGALMGYSAVTANNNQILKELNAGASPKETKGILLGKGTVDMLAKKYKDSNDVVWIEITSQGNLTDEKISTKSILYVDPNNTNNIKWNSF